VHVLFAWVAVAVIIAFNPFQVLSATGQLTETLSLRIQSIWFDKPESDSDVVTVVIDDASVRHLTTSGYPVPFDVHAQLTRAILCAGPSAIFIDIEFQAVRPDPDLRETRRSAAQNLADALATTPNSRDCPALSGDLSATTLGVMERNPEVFLARTRPLTIDECKLGFEEAPSGCADHGLMEAVRNEVTHLTITTSGPEKRHIHYPLLAGPSNTFLTEETLSPVTIIDQVGLIEPSPASALLLARCQQGRATGAQLSLCEQLTTALQIGEDISHLGELTLIPQWRYYINTSDPWFQLINQSTDGATLPCRANQLVDGTIGNLSLWQRSKVFLLEFTAGVFYGVGGRNWLGSHSIAICNPYRSINARQLKAEIDRCESSAGCDAFLHELFAGRSVVYGYGVAASNDSISSPVIGVIPGLFLHSAAADNLISMGSDYVREGRQIPWIEVEFGGEALELFLITLLLIIAVGLSKRMPWLNRGIKKALLFSIIIGIGIATIYFLKLAPFDWLVIVGLGALALKFSMDRPGYPLNSQLKH
jgi:CHASE2 domain-containing sensor protein